MKSDQPYETLVDMGTEVISNNQFKEGEITSQDDLEFQNFILHDAEESLLEGNLTSNKLPPSYNQFSSPPQPLPQPFPQGHDPFTPPLQNQQLPAPKSNYSFWNIEYYAIYFNVDTEQVTHRIKSSLYPLTDFQQVLNSNPDLYGPFWLSCTLVFLLFMAASITGSINSYIAGREHSYDFLQLSIATGIVSSQGLGIPVGIWLMGKYFTQGPTLLHILNVFGYSQSIWILITAFSIIPLDIVRWLLVGVGIAISGTFLIKNTQMSGNILRPTQIILFLLQIVYGFLLKIYFYSFTVVENP